MARKQKAKKIRNSEVVFVYLMWTWASPGRVKIGISNSPTKRAAGIRERLEIKERIFVVFALPLAYAYFVEQSMHSMFRFAWRPWRGDGKTEWFNVLILPAAMATILIVFLLQAMTAIVLIILLFNLIIPAQ